MLPASRTGGEGVVLHTLFDLKPIRADFTLVLVDWHGSFPPAKTEIECYTADGAITLGKLFECHVEAIHSPDNRFHTGRIRQSNMLGTSKRFTGNHRNF